MQTRSQKGQFGRDFNSEGLSPPATSLRSKRIAFMDKQYEKHYHALEESHWWFVSRRRKILSMIDICPHKTYLDIGCSSGKLLEGLIEKGADPNQVIGIDISPVGIEACQAKGLTNTFVMDATSLNLPAGSFDVIIASDCLEHIQQDEVALQNWYKLLKPDGIMIVFVPAFMSLWSPHDEVNHHFRRYTHRELMDKISKASFSTLRHGYWNATLFIPIMAYRFLRKILNIRCLKEKKPSADLGTVPGPVNALLKGLLSIENSAMELIRFPFGVSTFCVARRSAGEGNYS